MKILEEYTIDLVEDACHTQYEENKISSSSFRKRLLGTLFNPLKVYLIQGLSWRETWEKLSLNSVSLLPISSSGREGITLGYIEKNIPKDYRFSPKLQNTVKTSPCFKFVGLPLWYIKTFLLPHCKWYNQRPPKIKTALTIKTTWFSTKMLFFQCKVIEACSLLRPLSTSTIGGLIVGTSL